MLKDFLTPYLKASDLVAYHRSNHKKLIFRSILAYGIALGLLLNILYLAGNNYPIPLAFPILQGLFFIYGSVMFGLATRLLNNQISLYEKFKFNKLCDLQELDFLPITDNADKTKT